MTALCVDDEMLLLNALVRAVEQSPDVDRVDAFDDEYDALDWAATHSFDVAFLDIQLHVMSGLELAKRLHEINPKLPIIFCTGYMNFALDAFRVHAAGYLLKPITKERVQEELDHLKTLNEKKYLLTVRCYGRFEVLNADGVPLDFMRSRAKELLALLVAQDGKEIGSREICALLFNEADGELDSKDRNHFYKLIRELNRVLSEAGAERVLLRSGGVYCLDMELIHKDNSRRGKEPYMEGYHWAV